MYSTISKDFEAAKDHALFYYDYSKENVLAREKENVRTELISLMDKKL